MRTWEIRKHNPYSTVRVKRHPSHIAKTSTRHRTAFPLKCAHKTRTRTQSLTLCRRWARLCAGTAAGCRGRRAVLLVLLLLLLLLVVLLLGLLEEGEDVLGYDTRTHARAKVTFDFNLQIWPTLPLLSPYPSFLPLRRQNSDS